MKPVAQAHNIQAKKKNMQRSMISLALLLLLAILLGAFNVPGRMQRTHPSIVEQKQKSRDVCKAAIERFDFSAAEAAIRNSKLSKDLYRQFREAHSKTLAHTIMPVVEFLIFRVGVLCAVAPLYLVLLAQTFAHGHNILPSNADWSLVFLPALNTATSYCWVVVSVFHLWLREQQVSSCLLLSGHWYTFAHTVAAFILVLVFFSTGCPKHPPGDHGWTSTKDFCGYYIAYFCIYLALALNVLKNSQMYHHDDIEAIQGLRSFVMTLIFSAPAGLMVLHRSLKAGQSRQSRAGRVSKALQQGAFCEVLVGHQQVEGDNSASVSAGDKVQILDDENPDENGWVHVRIASNIAAGDAQQVSLKEGWIPAYCLMEIETRAETVQTSGELPQSEKEANLVATNEAGVKSLSSLLPPVSQSPFQDFPDPSSEKQAVVQEAGVEGVQSPSKPLRQTPFGANSSVLEALKGTGAKASLKKVAGAEDAQRTSKPLRPAPVGRSNALLDALKGAGAKASLKKVAPGLSKPPNAKPCPPDDLKGMLEQAIAARRLSVSPHQAENDNEMEDDFE